MICPGFVGADHRVCHNPLHELKGGGWGEGILGFLGILFVIALHANPMIGAAYLPYLLVFLW